MSIFVLVHGAWHDSRCWELLTPYLTAAGHQVLTPDLPGHGRSTLPPQRATLKLYAQTLTEIIRGCSDPVILVGHSMAGMVITEAASLIPAHITQLIYLCAYLPRQDESVFSLIASNRGHEPLTPIEMALSMSADKRTCNLELDAAGITSLFYGSSSPAQARVAIARLQVQGSLPLAAEVRYDEQQLQTVPKRYIYCTEDKVIPLHHQRRMVAHHSTVTAQTLTEQKFTGQTLTTQTLASDHSPFYCCPAELAAALTSS
jgi:pimeloyl-ACP methyl ester carboxylesterase